MDGYSIIQIILLSDILILAIWDDIAPMAARSAVASADTSAAVADCRIAACDGRRQPGASEASPLLGAHALPALLPHGLRLQVEHLHLRSRAVLIGGGGA